VRVKKWVPEKFTIEFRDLVNKRYEFPLKFFESFMRKDRWAVNLAKNAYYNGKTHSSSLEEFVENYRALCKEDEEIRKDALDYIEGKKFEEFELFLKRR
jgi:hypothetical protein